MGTQLHGSCHAGPSRSHPLPSKPQIQTARAGLLVTQTAHTLRVVPGYRETGILLGRKDCILAQAYIPLATMGSLGGFPGSGG